MAYVTHWFARYYSSADGQQYVSVTLTRLTEWWKGTNALLTCDADKVGESTDEYQRLRPLCHPQSPFLTFFLFISLQ